MKVNAIVAYDISDNNFRSKVREFYKDSSVTFQNTANLVEASKNDYEFGNQRSVF